MCKNCVHCHEFKNLSILCKMHKEKYKHAGVVLYCTAKEVEK